MREIKAPDPWPPHEGPLVFLAGSIEMGDAEQWQEYVRRCLATTDDGILLNPRRDDWDASWAQEIENPEFFGQVEWELSAMEAVDVIAMYFDPGTKSPITLLELGLYARSRKLLVCCPRGFWRRGNVEIVCRRYGVPFLPDLDALVRGIRRRIRNCLVAHLQLMF